MFKIIDKRVRKRVQKGLLKLENTQKLEPSIKKATPEKDKTTNMKEIIVRKRNVYEEVEYVVQNKPIPNPMDKSIRDICSFDFTDFTKDQSDINQYLPTLM